MSVPVKKRGISIVQTTVFPCVLRCEDSLQDLPTLFKALPVDGETWRRRGSMNGVKEEEDLCFCMVLLLDWLCTGGKPDRLTYCATWLGENTKMYWHNIVICLDVMKLADT